MRHHHGSDTPTSARAVLHHTDPKVPNIMEPSVPFIYSKVYNSYSEKIIIAYIFEIQKVFSPFHLWYIPYIYFG